ncbi:uncharacterized protein LOC114540985 [Dendronephthya gigantea]|uniref:uncharacterized protein LOC114540985 n=1 Tax=Dendronephthya gigantea TaxID=151771 RepID=UPI001069B4DC|nr:uncharacterized protein LOC114540985 [Dendronephthya gigantea]
MASIDHQNRSIVHRSRSINDSEIESIVHQRFPSHNQSIRIHGRTLPISNERGSIDYRTPPSNHQNQTIDHRTPPSNHQNQTIDRRTPPSNQQNQTIDHRTSPSNHQNQTIDHRTPPTNHQNQTIDHRTLPSNYQNQTIDHRTPPTNHQNQTIDHRTPPSNHQNQTIDHRTPPTNHQNKTIDHRTPPNNQQNRTIDHRTSPNNQQNRTTDHRTSPNNQQNQTIIEPHQIINKTKLLTIELPPNNHETQLNSTARKMLKRKEDHFQQAQDSYYGKGCKTSLYRSRLKIIFNVWREIAKRRNITRYFIAFGSFLGAVRNGDVIPYDSDIDVCIFKDEYHKLFPEESSRPLDLNDGTVHLLLQRHSPHPKDDTPRKDCKGNVVRRVTDDCAILDPHGRLFQGPFVYMDIFVVKDFRSVVYDEYKRKYLKRDIVLPLRPCRFLGMSTYCPNDTARYLTAHYGATYLKPHHICQGKRWIKNLL